MQKTSSWVRSFALLTIACSMGDLWSQPGLSRMAGRFHVREMTFRSDTVVREMSLPVWFPFLGNGSVLYFGALNRYGLGGLTEWVAGGSFPMASGGMQWDAFTSGDVNYRRAGGQVGLIRKLSPSVWLGTGLGFSFTGVRGYGTRWSPQTRVGLSGLIGSKSTWGFTWENPQTVLSSKSWYAYEAMRIRLGVVHGISNRLDLNGSMEWESVAGASVLLRANYRITDQWKMSIGWAWQPEQLLFSLQRRLRKGWVGVGFSQDPVLGSSFSFFSQWRSQKNNK